MIENLRKKQFNVFLKANYISRLFFCWLNDLIKVGFKKKLEVTDLYDILPEDSTEYLCSKLEKQWKKEILKSGKNSKPSLAKALFKTFSRPVICWSSFSVLEEFIRISQPFFIGKFIGYFTTMTKLNSLNNMPDDANQTNNTNAGEQMSQTINGQQMEAYMYALAVCLCAIIPTIIHHHYYWVYMKSGMHLRAACCALIQKKLLRLSMVFMPDGLDGQMASFLSNDAYKFDRCISILPGLIIAPLELVAVTIILWFYIGWATISGMVVFILVIPVVFGLTNLIDSLRATMMKHTDIRLSQTKELMHGMRMIKMSCWEHYLEHSLKQTRKFEIRKILKIGCIRALLLGSGYVTIKSVIYFVFLTFIVMGNEINAKLVFVAMSLYGPMSQSISLIFPMAVQLGTEMLTSVRRIQDFLLLEERDSTLLISQTPIKINRPSVSFESATTSWDRKQFATPLLTNLTFHIQENDLLFVLGPVGVGKSSLLMMILKELPLISGMVDTQGTIAYSSQKAWMFNGSIRQNIIFGSEFNEERYKNVIRSCALEEDLSLMPEGDLTLVGENGDALSGGQRSRINLARAIYRTADIYLLDDPFNSVDEIVGMHIFNECINGFLSGKLRIVVTHDTRFLNRTSKVLLLDRDQNHKFGSFEEISRNNIDFEELVIELNIMKDNAVFSYNKVTTYESCKEITSPLQIFHTGVNSDPIDEIIVDDLGSSRTSRLISESCKLISSKNTENDSDVDKLKFEGEEQKDNKEAYQGSPVPSRLYLLYVLNGAGVIGVVILLVLNIGTQCCYVVTDFWLITWCNALESFHNEIIMSQTNPQIFNGNNLTALFNEPVTFPKNMWYLNIYTFLTLLVIILSLIKALYSFWLIITSNHRLHNNLLHSVVHLPISFFTTNPAGRIINRFSKDLGVIDDLIPMVIFDFLQKIGFVASIFLSLVIMNPWTLLGILPMFICFLIIRNYFVRTFRNVSRIEAIAKSPIFSHFGAVHLGLQTIRSHGMEKKLTKEYYELQDTYNSANWIRFGMGRWMSIRLEWLCCAFLCLVSFGALFASNSMTGASVGLSLNYVMSLLFLLQWVVKQSAELENYMVHVERITEYTNIPLEQQVFKRDSFKFSKVSKFKSSKLTLVYNFEVSDNFIRCGGIQFIDVSLKYLPDSYRVLENLNFVIKPGERIGIMGRTGAGKSSLVNVLFQLVEYEGVVLIDGVDISTLNKHEARRCISVISQEPLLFQGSLRMNLDLMHEHSDDELLKVLNKVNLNLSCKESQTSLDFWINESGKNLSLGQQQMLCLARALLKKNKILIVDEATANVDEKMEKSMHELIKKEFTDCTIICISHRLKTVIECDRIMILNNGTIEESDSPLNLLRNERSAINCMSRQKGPVHHANLLNLAEQAQNKRTTY